MPERLEDRFRALDEVRSPERWPDLETFEPSGRPARRLRPADRWRRPVAALTALALAAAAIGFAVWVFDRNPAPGPAALPTNGKLAFAAYGQPPQPDRGAAYSVDPDGTDLVRLSGSSGPPAYDVWDVVWSPDGHRLLVERAGDERTVRLLDPTTATEVILRALMESYSAENPFGVAWSPDGERLAYSGRSAQEGASLAGTSIHVSPIDRGPSRQVTAGPADVGAAWSPDGEKIVFARWGHARYLGFDCDRPPDQIDYGLHVVPRDGGEEIRLTDDGCDAAPDWSPDGATVAFIRRDATIASIPASGGEVQVLLEYAADPGCRDRGTELHEGREPPAVHDLSWSPDGRRLAFVADDCLYTMRSDGTDVRMVVGPDSGLFASSVDWGTAPTTTATSATEERSGATTMRSEEINDVRCEAEVPRVVQPGRPVGVRAWIENLRDEPIRHNAASSVANVVVYDGQGRLVWDSLDSFGPDRAILGIGDTQIAPGERVPLGVYDTPVRWPGPLTVTVACALEENGTFELASVDVSVAVPGPTPIRERALPMAFQATRGFFGECGADGNPRVGAIPAPVRSSDVPPMEVRCLADIELHDGFAVVTIHFESPPDAPRTFRVGRYLHETTAPDGPDPAIAGRWVLVVTENDVFHAIPLETVFSRPTGAALAIYSFSESGWYRGEGACSEEPGEYRSGIVFLLPC